MRTFLLPVVGALLLSALPGLARAQDSLPPASDSLAALAPDSLAAPEVAQTGDSIIYARAPVSPMGAFWRSLLVPGWGQAKLDRKLTGALFIAWEGVTLGMALKATHELNYLEATGSGSVDAKKKEQQDWFVLLGFNHLLSAIEAYVSTHLWDFPGDLKIRAAPGRRGATASFSLPLP